MSIGAVKVNFFFFYKILNVKNFSNNISEERIKKAENLIRKITKVRLSRVLMISVMKEKLKDTPKIYNDIIPRLF